MIHVFGARVIGPLEMHAQGLATELLREGYTANGAAQHLCFIAHLSRWMAAKNLRAAALTPRVARQYMATRRADGYTNYRSPKALQPLLDYLGSRGIIPAAEVAPVDAATALLQDYRRFLTGERSLTEGTARGYVDAVRAFVAESIRAKGIDKVSAGDITDFILAACPTMATGSRKLRVTALRSLLKWLHVKGIIPAALACSVPSVAGSRLAALPRAVDAQQLHRLLASCDRRRAPGRRDYAIMLLLSRLGLRSGEVARLALDDIDWRNGQIRVSGKGNRTERLPMPVDVGEALLGYLQRGRPHTAQGRNLFVRIRAPHRELTSTGVTQVVFAASQRAGLGKLHAHRLRHTAATAMLRAGSSLVEVGQVLRHRLALTTAIYAKVDRNSLRALARPWPGGLS